MIIEIVPFLGGGGGLKYKDTVCKLGKTRGNDQERIESNLTSKWKEIHIQIIKHSQRHLEVLSQTGVYPARFPIENSSNIHFSSIQGSGSGATFWNTIPSSRRTTNQTACNTTYGEGSGSTFEIPPHRAAGPQTRPRYYRMEMDGPLFDDGRSRPALGRRKK